MYRNLRELAEPRGLHSPKKELSIQLHDIQKHMTYDISIYTHAFIYIYISVYIHMYVVIEGQRQAGSLRRGESTEGLYEAYDRIV